MLYETAARSAEVLRLDVGDLDLPNRQAKVRRKGGAIDIIVWQTGTARPPKGRMAGAATPMLMAKSGHTSVASLARYARPSAEALARWQERNDPARRR